MIHDREKFRWITRYYIVARYVVRAAAKDREISSGHALDYRDAVSRSQVARCRLAVSLFGAFSQFHPRGAGVETPEIIAGATFQDSARSAPAPGNVGFGGLKSRFEAVQRKAAQG